MRETLVALIRGINLGTAKRVAMADLRSLIKELGFENVSTVLNSGNVIFTANDKDIGNLANQIQQSLLKRTGVSAKVTVLTAKEIELIVSDNPFEKIALDPTRLIVAVLMNTEDKVKISKLDQQLWEPELLFVGQRVAYMWCPNGLLASKLSTSVNRALGENVTSRNMSTLLKIHASMSKISCI